ncbi:hypothetical protein CAMGR0001_2400 [Campylobacter gracilis RM3268]|uniref:Uncharacterized protein n=1 Tax=Campylobacter gracilis RM3268 TaxID=553220 RepID=C8PE50_9BACT|nr:hypothetical protein CAMGR0001_2400 [Campylobacter gracilis RM3268]
MGLKARFAIGRLSKIFKNLICFGDARVKFKMYNGVSKSSFVHCRAFCESVFWWKSKTLKV